MTASRLLTSLLTVVLAALGLAAVAPPAAGPCRYTSGRIDTAGTFAFTGPPDAFTVFPQRMSIDYVRIHQ